MLVEERPSTHCPYLPRPVKPTSIAGAQFRPRAQDHGRQRRSLPAKMEASREQAGDLVVTLLRWAAAQSEGAAKLSA
jgi:hypothetical protein